MTEEQRTIQILESSLMTAQVIFYAYWNSTGTTSPTAILNAPAFNLKYDATS